MQFDRQGSRSGRHSLYGTQSDRPWSRSDCLGCQWDPIPFISAYPFLLPPTPSFEPKQKTPLSLSQGENNLSWGKALPFDLGPTEGIPGLTATSSSIPSGYFFDFSSLSPWILLPRVHNIKDEDSILDHGFIGLMVGIVLWCQYESIQSLVGWFAWKVLKSNGDFLSCSCSNTIHMSSLFSRWCFKVLTSKRRKRGLILRKG
jgi:hypothetical protein